MHLEILDQHDVMGIDFDGTLVEHARSKILQQYIVDHPEKTFHLISFRTHGMKLRLEQHLQHSTDETGVPLTLEHFTSINCIPDLLYERKGLIDDGREYWGWKALKCKELGCTIMVDDMYEIVGLFCHEIGIPCLNPDIYPGYVAPTATQELQDWLAEGRDKYGDCKSPELDELHRNGRIVWYHDETTTEAHLSWPPPDDTVWIALVDEHFHDLRIKAIEVLGSQAEAERWLETPAMALEQHRPIDMMLTLPGAVAVEELLSRIEHGVYT